MMGFFIVFKPLVMPVVRLSLSEGYARKTPFDIIELRSGNCNESKGGHSK